MFGDRCGARLHDSQSFCPACGKAAGTVPLMPVQSRIGGHVRLLGILWLASSAMYLIPGLFLTSFFGNFWSFLPHGVPFFVHSLMRAAGVFFLAGAILGIAAGWGLLERQPWARMLAIVLGCFQLLHMPFGTALGVYTLWVLLPAKSEEEYRRMSRAA